MGNVLPHSPTSTPQGLLASSHLHGEHTGLRARREGEHEGLGDQALLQPELSDSTAQDERTEDLSIAHPHGFNQSHRYSSLQLSAMGRVTEKGSPQFPKQKPFPSLCTKQNVDM